MNRLALIVGAVVVCLVGCGRDIKSTKEWQATYADLQQAKTRLEKIEVEGRRYLDTESLVKETIGRLKTANANNGNVLSDDQIEIIARENVHNESQELLAEATKQIQLVKDLEIKLERIERGL